MPRSGTSIQSSSVHGIFCVQCQHAYSEKHSWFDVGNIIAKINDKFHITIAYSKAWHAKTKALSKIFGDWELSYETLPQYLEAFKNSNPDTITCLKVEPCALEYGLIVPNMVWFSCVFWAFGPSIEGGSSCRPLLSIDGTHLYGKCRDCLLIVIGVNADSELHPLAFIAVENESKNHWLWFL